MQLVGSYTFSAKYDFIKVKYMNTKNISLKSLCRNILVKLKKGGGVIGVRYTAVLPDVLTHCYTQFPKMIHYYYDDLL